MYAQPLSSLDEGDGSIAKKFGKDFNSLHVWSVVGKFRLNRPITTEMQATPPNAAEGAQSTRIDQSSERTTYIHPKFLAFPPGHIICRSFADLLQWCFHC